MSKTLVIKSKPGNLRQVEKFVDEISEEFNLSDEIYGNLLIATLEGTNNAIIHGNGGDPEKDVEIHCYLEEKQVILTITDKGKGFDYTSIPDPTAPENLEKINGRGVFLMTRLSDEIEFLKNGAEVKITFNTEI
jgi:serine/threonine-protein kinase RsbW